LYLYILSITSLHHTFERWNVGPPW